MRGCVNKVQARDPSAERLCRGVKAAVAVLSLVISAAALSAALRLPGAGWLAWFALLPLFLLIRICSPFRACMGGALWGVSLFVFWGRGLSGMEHSLLGLALLAAAPAAYAGLGALMTRAIGFSPLLLAIGWVFVELAVDPLSPRPGLLSITQRGSPHLHWISTILGSAFVAFLVAAVNAALLAVISTVRIDPSCSNVIGGRNHSQRAKLAWSAPDLKLWTAGRVHQRAPPGAPVCLSTSWTFPI